MSFEDSKFVIGVFKDEHHMVAAARDLKASNIEIHDIYTPFPLHGLDEILGIKRSRLPIVAFIAGSLGFVLSLYFQYWVSVKDWPLIIGGKPFNSIPAFIPVTFEITVLFSAFISVGAFLACTKLFPGKKAYSPDIHITDSTFVIAVEEKHVGQEFEGVAKILRAHHPHSVELKMGRQFI